MIMHPSKSSALLLVRTRSEADTGAWRGSSLRGETCVRKGQTKKRRRKGVTPVGWLHISNVSHALKHCSLNQLSQCAGERTDQIGRLIKGL